MGFTDKLLKRSEPLRPGSVPTPLSPWLKKAAIFAVPALFLIYPFLPFVSNYWIDIGFFFGIYALLGLSLNIVLGEVGLFDLGHTGFYAIGAYVTAILNTRFGLPIVLLAPISALVAAGFAYLATSPIIHLKGDYLCIVTIGIGEIVRLTMINNPFGVTGGPNGVNGVDGPSLGFAIQSSTQFYFYIWVIIALVIFSLHRLQRSRVGRAWNYIREDSIAAEASGIDVRSHKLLAFVIGAGLAGLAGNIYASKQMSVSPESFTFMESALLFSIVLLGGLGSVPGTILGALVVVVFPEVFRTFANYRLLFFGLALILMMIFKPAGILPRRRGAGGLKDLGIKDFHDSGAGAAPPVAKTAPAPDRIVSADSKGMLLCTDSVCINFGGLQAVNRLAIGVALHKITALIGPNGAGKTTLFNMITGIYKPSAGHVLFGGRDITAEKPHTIVSRGIARTFQNIRLFPSLTCIENVMSGPHCHARTGSLDAVLRSRRQVSEEQRIAESASWRLAQVGLWDYRNELAKNLPYGKQRYLEIARAMASDPALLILDEPSSGLNDKETEEMMALLSQLMKDNLSILLIEHHMNVVMGISDHVVVMDMGCKIAEGSPKEMYNDPRVIEAYLGKEED